VIQASLDEALRALNLLGVPDRDVAMYSSVTLKNPWLNAKFRQLCVEMGYENQDAAHELWMICARDPLFFLNTFAYLLETREKQDWDIGSRYGSNKVIPFITRGYQDTLIMDVLPFLGRQDIVIPKSRETGISWMIGGALAAWDWIFHDQTHIGFVSKDLLSANNPDDPDALFSKFHFLLEHLPYWMLSPTDYERNITKNTFRNLRNKSSLTAYAAKADIGRGGRKSWMLMDEFHFFEQGDDYAALDSTVHVTPCRVFVSTANRERGMAGAFYDVVSDATKNGAMIVIDWKDDPDKARGLYHAELIEGTETYKLVIDDHEFWDEYDNGDGTYRHPFPEHVKKNLPKDQELPEGPINYPFILDDRVRSLYYDHVWHRPGSTPQSVAAELDRNFGGATAQIFNPQLLQRALERAKSPFKMGDFTHIMGEKPTWKFEPLAFGGQVNLWLDLIEGPDGLMPPKDEYVFGADIAAGTGGEWSSYSALEGLNKKTGEQVFEFRTNRMDPIQFGDLCVWVMNWFHRAYLVPEVNGPLGQLFINKVARDLKYGNIYRRVKQNVAYREATERVGYVNADRGIELLKNLESQIRHARVHANSEVALNECSRYFLKNGKLVHSAEQATDDGAGKGLAHGDAAIALGCAAYGVDEIPIPPEEEVKSEAPYQSFLWRRQQFEQALRQRNKKSYWSPEY
jgi:hypothetical protein